MNFAMKMIVIEQGCYCRCTMSDNDQQRVRVSIQWLMVSFY